MSNTTSEFAVVTGGSAGIGYELARQLLQHAEKDDPTDIAKTDFDALMRGEGDVVHGLKNKMRVAASKVVSDDRMAKQHAKMSRPGSGQR